ncbi:hypothetical protein A2U01_0088583, partial [Trifolium medium]|nr:hypothetical protein [Trifolium medium]
GFWYLRAAQWYVARCASHGITTGSSSGSCAPRSPNWRVAQLSQAVEENLLGVARRAG